MNPYITEKRLDANSKDRFRIAAGTLNAYLYLLTEEGIKKLVGTLTKNARGHAKFVYYDGNSCSNKYFIVNQIEGLAYNNKLWLRDDNVEKAKQLFIEIKNEDFNYYKKKLEQIQQELLVLHTQKEN
jgi:hypothetical protein